MNFIQYQKRAKETLVKNNNEEALLIARLALGLTGEAGEVAEKVKKYLRDCNIEDPATVLGLSETVFKELGDCLWYIANLADVLGLDIDSIAKDNLKKLASRKERGTIRGSGDNR